MAKRAQGQEAPPMGDLTPDTVPAEQDVAPPETLTPDSAHNPVIDLREPTPSETRPVEPPVKPPETLAPASSADTIKADKEIGRLERERRRYIKRTGGLRKNLCSADAVKAKELSDKLGLKVTDPWMPIHIFGYDNITHGQPRGRQWNTNEEKAARV